MDKKIVVQTSENFERNLDSIADFLSQADAPQAFDMLLTNIVEKIIPNLERFPDIGRLFVQKKTNSVEVNNELEVLQKKLQGGNLHEYLLQDYLILYARYGATITLLSIKHHRQLSFDFNARWG